MKAWKAELYDSKSFAQFEIGMKLINELNIKNGEKILDIGCGTGRLTMEIAKKNPGGLVIGLDNSQDMIDKANFNLKNWGLKNLKFIKANILQYEPEVQFNAVYSNSALHWIENTRDLFVKIYNILLPEGRILAQIPAGGLHQYIPLFIATIQSLNLSQYFKNWKFPSRLTNPKILMKLLSSIGFNDVQIKKVTQKVKFETLEDLIAWLQTGPLVAILSQLPAKKREKYLNYLLNIFKSKGDSILEAQMNRICIKAIK
ncbi:MAG: methyltransferase domain-containing protein [Candidatus Helarchaeota archaeon]|nr:methyltransferase domain-containing protein [Candidatus Helarchaeota archaeon]